MRRAWLIPLALAAALVWPVATSQGPKTTAQEAPPPGGDAGGPDAEGTEVLTRGPIHEAFAEPVTEPEPTLVVPKRPPEDIEEVPPDYAPEGEDAIWIKGYWAWDDEREDYIWISGVHRVPPPGMRWVAGYWEETDGGWQWIRGFWLSAEVEELEYRDPPPPTLEAGPSSPSPGDDYYYVPGNWGYYETGYRWSPGYWSIYRPNWCWVPARWVWTPRGCIYLNGYSDWTFARRGFCYAPIYFHRPIYATPGYYYRPWCGLNTANLFVHFWVRPRYCHYYFGNYYGSYDRWGMSPWHSYYGRGGFYDPLLSFNVVHFRSRGINYVDRIGGWHRYYDRHVDERPPITFADQGRLASRVNVRNITEINNITNVSVKQNFLAGNVRDLARMETTPVRLRQLSSEQKERATKRAREVSQEIVEVRKQRREMERVAKADRPDRGPDVGAKGEKGVDVGAKGEKGADIGAKGKAGADVGAKGRGAERRAETRARLKLPQSRVALEQPRVEVPEPPDGSRRGVGQARGGAEGRATKGADRGARTPTGEKGVKGTDRPDQPSADRGKGKGKAKGGKAPDADAPSVDLPDRPGAGRPELPGVDRGSDQPRPGPRVEGPEGGRPDRGPRSDGEDRPGRAKGKGGPPRSSERPELDGPRPEPRVERPEPGPRVDRPEPRVDRPEPRVERREPGPRVDRPEPNVERPEPRVDRPEPRVDRPAPRVERPQPGPRVDRPEPRIESPEPRVERPTPGPRVDRPEPRVERPAPRIERSEPRIERPEPRVERSAPPPRIERSSSPPRVERSSPEPRAERSSPRPSSRPASSNSSRGKGRSRDRE